MTTTGWLMSIFWTASLLALLIFSLPMQSIAGQGVVIGAVITLSGFYYFYFPNSKFFIVVFANSIAIYACIFIFFIETNYPLLSQRHQSIGFVLPLMAFLLGSVWKKNKIQKIVTVEKRSPERTFSRSLIWIMAIMFVGIVSIAAPIEALPLITNTWIFYIIMVAISLTVLLVSQEVAIFLVDTGLLFADIFDEVKGIIKPAFAFFTFYSFIVVVFSALYRLADQLSYSTNFIVHGEARSLSFIESLYFSIVTMSTLGYGDIVPVSNTIMALVSVQVFIGVLLLIFGVHSLIQYSPRGRKNRHAPPPSDQK